MSQLPVRCRTALPAQHLATAGILLRGFFLAHASQRQAMKQPLRKPRQPTPSFLLPREPGPMRSVATLNGEAHRRCSSYLAPARRESVCAELNWRLPATPEDAWHHRLQLPKLMDVVLPSSPAPSSTGMPPQADLPNL